MNSIRRLLILTSILVLPITVSAQGLDTAKMDQALGRSGQKMGDVYKVGFPRTDLHVSVHGLAIKPGLALAYETNTSSRGEAEWLSFNSPI